MTSVSLPEAWSDLIEAITLLVKGRSDDVSPFNCTHDRLGVMADPGKFTEEELSRLEEWGFDVDSANGMFYSYRYGSA